MLAELRRVSLLMAIGLLAACSGGDGGKGAAPGAGWGSPPANAVSTGIWSGTLTPADSTQAPASGWLVIAADGSMHLDTDMALFTGTTRTQGKAFTASATGHPYNHHFANGSAFTFRGEVVEAGLLNGTWSGAGGGGTMTFRYEGDVSQQAAALGRIARTYESELWVGDATHIVNITITGNGTLTARAGNGCTVNGRITVADPARNGYRWTAEFTGCAANGTATGTGFMTGDSSIYFSGTLPDGPVWMGGMDQDATVMAGG